MRAHVLIRLDLDEFLHEAVEDGDIERVRYLLTRHPRPRIESRNEWSRSALDLASQENHVIIMQLLVNVGGAALSATALRCATRCDSFEAITYLVGSSKNPFSYVNLLDDDKKSVLLNTMPFGRRTEKTVRHLIDLGADAALKDTQGRNIAHHACSQSHFSLTAFKALINSAEIGRAHV